MLGSPMVSADKALDESIARLCDASADLREAAQSSTPSARANAACTALRIADELSAFAVNCVDTTDIEAATGLSAEMMLQLEAGRMQSEARMITAAAATMHAMPNLSDAFFDGTVSWGQVRSIMGAIKIVRAEGRLEIDELIGQSAPSLAGCDPDRLVALVDDAVLRQRADLAIARENRAVEKSFFSIQGRLDGTSSMYGEGDAVSTTTIATALDLASDAPEAPEKNGVTRAQQRYEGLVRVCEAYLGGNSGGYARPKTKILATMQLKDLTDPSCADSMKLLWPLAGRPAALSSVTRDMLLCDATIVPILFDRDRPIAVGDAADTISPKVRTALIARDAGCRFPGCNAPAQWCDAHHIIPGVGNQVEDLVLLCRRCHRRLHNRRWRMQLQSDGGVLFTRRGQKHTTYPRHRSPPVLE